MTQELDASFMYAAGQGSAITITRDCGHTACTNWQVIAWRPSAYPGQTSWNPGAEFVSSQAIAEAHP
jgi:hypothetical protein